MQVDASYLESLMGYNARRAALHIIAALDDLFAEQALSPVSFSVLSLVHHNPGITSQQLCKALNLKAPNLTVMVASFEKQHWVTKQPSTQDRRSVGLSLTNVAKRVVSKLERNISHRELLISERLNTEELDQLKRLLQKLYLVESANSPAPAYKPSHRSTRPLADSSAPQIQA